MDDLGDGAWCWFQAPRALRHVGGHDRTYAGWVSPEGDIVAGYRDHDTGERGTVTLHERFERDDHDNPAFHVADGRLLAFYTRHGGPEIHYREVDPGSLSLGPEETIAPSSEHTYPNPRVLDGDLHLFYRNARGSLAYVVREGEDWSGERELITTGGREWCVYPQVSAVADGRVAVALTFAEGGTHDPHRDVRCVTFDGNVVRTVGGRALGVAPESVAFSETPVVYDSGSGHHAWVWDCAHAAQPEIVYATFPSTDDHRYRYARWTGEEWHDEALVDAGSHIVEGNAETYYSGGAALDGAESGVCYLSVGDHDGSELLRYERGVGGWTATTVAEADGEQNVRPVVARNRHPDTPVLWLRGRYTYYADGGYETRIVEQG
jgi:hypothetical protein